MHVPSWVGTRTSYAGEQTPSFRNGRARLPDRARSALPAIVRRRAAGEAAKGMRDDLLGLYPSGAEPIKLYAQPTVFLESRSASPRQKLRSRRSELRHLLISARGLLHLLRSRPLRQADPGSLAGKFSNVIDSELTWQLRKEFVRLRWPLPSRLPRGSFPTYWSTDLLTTSARSPRSTGAEKIQPEASFLRDECFQALSCRADLGALFVILPRCCFSPELFSRGTSPR
jgi:hypothetical protein